MRKEKRNLERERGKRREVAGPKGKKKVRVGLTRPGFLMKLYPIQG